MSTSNTDFDEIPLSPVPRAGQQGSRNGSDEDQARTLPGLTHPVMTSTDAEPPPHQGKGRNTSVENESSSPAPPASRPRGRQRLRAGLSKVGTTLQKLNLAKLIDDMEHDQELADRLEVINRDILEERDRKDLVREAHDRCRAEIEQHLDEYLTGHPTATYEDWIQDLHPDNVSDGTLFADMKQVDMRFYVIDSDHRIMWNQAVGDDRQVTSRTYHPPEPAGDTRQQPAAPVDFLDSGWTSSP